MTKAFDLGIVAAWTALVCSLSAFAGGVIVLPEKPTGSERFAAQELKHHLEKATGEALPIAFEPKKADADRRYFVGRVAALAAVGVDPAAFRPEERLVKGVGNDVYFVGGEIPDFDALRARSSDWETYGYAGGGTLYAVYDFLEKDMGVRWLWPGELGEVIPHRAVPTLDGVERRGVEPLTERCLRGDLEGTRRITVANRLWGWKDPANAHREVAARRLWLTRHRIGKRDRFNFGHAFQGWPTRYGDRPELFALQPSGRRGAFAGGAEGDERYYPLCVSNPDVHELIVSNWAASATFRPDWTPPPLNCCENDSPGFCVCERCRAWDADDPRFGTHPYWTGRIKDVNGRNRFFMAREQLGEDGEALEGSEPPSVTDRYVRFYNAVLAKARAIHPRANVCTYAYSNYAEAPRKTRVADGIVLSMVPGIGFPYGKAESNGFRKTWGGWNDMGATRMRYRPNYMYGGANMPYSCARRMAEDMNFAFAHGMTSVDQDSLLGAWSAQALKSYVAARILREPDASYEKMLGEFLSAFGKGADDVRRYCEQLEALNERMTADEWTKVGRTNRTRSGSPGGGFRGFVMNVADLYSEEWFETAKGVLAAAAGKTDGEARRRVLFLCKGLRDGWLTYRTRVAQKSGDDAAFRAAFAKLVDYRAKVEADLVCAFAWFADQEDALAGWPHETRRYSDPKAGLSGFRRGMGVGGWLANVKRVQLLPEELRQDVTPGDLRHMETFFTERDVRNIAGMGYDHIRLAFDQQTVEKGPGVWREEGFAHLRDASDWCRRHGLGLVLNLHRVWGNYNVQESRRLFEDAELQDRLVRLWAETEARFADRPEVVFELVNEIGNVDSGKWNALARRMVAAIRRRGKLRRIVIGPTLWNRVNRLGEMDVLDDPNVFYTFHFYEPHAFTHQRSQLSKDMHYANEACAYPEGTVDRAFLERALEPAFAWMGAHPDRTLWCGEFGTIRHADRASRQAWMRDVVSIFDAHGIPYCVWNYLTPPNDANRFSLVDDDTRRPLCEWGK